MTTPIKEFIDWRVLAADRACSTGSRSDALLRDPLCPRCKRGKMSIWHDDTGMYFKCGRCNYEFPQ